VTIVCVGNGTYKTGVKLVYLNTISRLNDLAEKKQFVINSLCKRHRYLI